MRKQERHLVHRERELARPGLLVPHPGMRRRVNRLRHKFVPGIWENSALSSDGAEQSVKHEQGARDRPAVTDPGGHTAPVVTTQFCSRSCNDLRDLFDCFGINAGFIGGEFESVISV